MVSAAGKLPDAEYSTANLGRPGSPYGTDCNAADMMKKRLAPCCKSSCQPVSCRIQQLLSKVQGHGERCPPNQQRRLEQQNLLQTANLVPWSLKEVRRAKAPGGNPFSKGVQDRRFQSFLTPG